MKNIEILNLVDSLNKNIEELKKLKGAKFAYAIIKNLELLNTESKLIHSINEVSEDFKSYDKERVSLCEKYAKKDENGNYIKNYITETSFEYKLDLKDPEFLKEMTELSDKYKEVLELHNSKTAEFNKFLLEESLVKFVDIDINSIPDDISVELLASIRPFIKD